MLRKTLRLRILLILPLAAVTAAFAAGPTPQETPQVVYLWPSGAATLQGAGEKEITNPPRPQPGQDPVKLLEKYGSRFELMHVKDMKKGTQTGDLTGKSDVKNDVTLGTGMMDWPAILKAAQRAGVKWYFIEDESPTSAQQIPLSLRYLERVKF